jgi:hypothetical protein
MVTAHSLEIGRIAVQNEELEQVVVRLQLAVENEAKVAKPSVWIIDVSPALGVADSARQRALAALGDWRVLEALYAGTASEGQVRLQGLNETEALSLRRKFRGAGWVVGPSEPLTKRDEASVEACLGSAAASRSTLCVTRPPDTEQVGDLFRLSKTGPAAEYIDEEELLPSAELAVPQDPSIREAGLSNCGETGSITAARPPCANCTCGRREQQPVDPVASLHLPAESRKITAEEAAPVATGSCNSCHLGDAFRCASCPYLGLPPFKPGAPLKIESSLLEGDL